MNREKVIKSLRSILLACKSDLAIHDLVKQFREWEETNIPFREFGCDSFVDFLRESGCFVLKATNDGLVVSAKQMANSKHVNDFVKEQNVSSKTRKPLRKKRSKLQHPRAPLEIIYENDHAMRYGIQTIRKQIQARGFQRAIGSARVQSGPLTQTQNSIGSQNGSNNRTNNVSVGTAYKVVTVQVPVQPEQQSQPTAPVNDIQNEQSLGTATKPANFRLSKFSQALTRALVAEPADLMPLKQQSKPEPDPDPQPQVKPFDFSELEAYRSAYQAIGVYCSKKGLPEPEYQFIKMNTKKIICSVTVNQTRYGCYPREYETQVEAQMATAEIALLEIKKLEESMKYPVCKDSPHDIAQQIKTCIGENGVFLDSLQTVFQSTHQQSLPDTWRLIVQNNADLFKLETDNFVGKTIVYPNKIDTRATRAVKKFKSFCVGRMTSNA